MGILLSALFLAAPPELVDAVQAEPRWIVSVDYATEKNFTGQKLYPVNRCLLRLEAVAMLEKAQGHLDRQQRGYRFLIKDCYRPVDVQHLMWKVVAGTPQQSYVANPHTRTGSIHNYGAAVDLTLADAEGQELDMGTPYDHLGPLAEPRHEPRFLKEGKLTARQVQNRKILREAMVTGGGFRMIRNEWWPFNAFSNQETRKRFEKLNVPLTVGLLPPAKKG